MIAGVDDVGLDHEVVADEVGRVGVVGEDAADFGGGEEDMLGLFGGEELVDGGGVDEIELSAGAGDEVGVAQPLQLAVDGGADQAAVAGDEDAVAGLHVGR